MRKILALLLLVPTFAWAGPVSTGSTGGIQLPVSQATAGPTATPAPTSTPAPTATPQFVGCSVAAGVLTCAGFTSTNTTPDVNFSTPHWDINEFGSSDHSLYFVNGNSTIGMNYVTTGSVDNTYLELFTNDADGQFGTNGNAGAQNKAWNQHLITYVLDYAGGGLNLGAGSGGGIRFFPKDDTFATGEAWEMDGTSGHLQSIQTAPAVTNTSANSCGTDAATLVGTDTSGKITVGATSGTSCTVTFTSAWTNAPACVANDETTATVHPTAISTTSTVIISGAFVAADKISYVCMGYH